MSLRWCDLSRISAVWHANSAAGCVQERINSELAVLASTRAKVDSPAVRALATASGQSISSSSSILLEELLRRPSISHRSLARTLARDACQTFNSMIGCT